MECIAILSHKYIMHGPGWFLHKSHHTKNTSFFELNDYYFIIFSLPSILNIVLGISIYDELADLNQDANIDVLDVVHIVNIILN